MNNIIKYINNIGQNTGTSNTGKKVMEKETSKLFADFTQNLNSGSFRTNGLTKTQSKRKKGKREGKRSARENKHAFERRIQKYQPERERERDRDREREKENSRPRAPAVSLSLSLARASQILLKIETLYFLPVLFVVAARQSRPVPSGRISRRAQKPNHQVQVINPEAVRDDVIPVHEIRAEEIRQAEETPHRPTFPGKRNASIEHALQTLRGLDAKFSERVAFELGRVFRGAVGEGFRHDSFLFVVVVVCVSSRVASSVSFVLACALFLSNLAFPQIRNPKKVLGEKFRIFSNKANFTSRDATKNARARFEE